MIDQINYMALARCIIASTPAGVYTLKQLFGPHWSVIHRKRWFGIQFKKEAREGLLARVTWQGQNSSKSQLYELAPD